MSTLVKMSYPFEKMRLKQLYKNEEVEELRQAWKQAGKEN